MAAKLRIIADDADIRAVLTALDQAPGIRIVDTSGPRPSRDGGVRVYAVAEVTPTTTAEDRAERQDPPPALPQRAPRQMFRKASK